MRDELRRSLFEDELQLLFRVSLGLQLLVFGL
jgi:hypothetical protein